MPARPRANDLTILVAGLATTVILAAISAMLAPEDRSPRAAGSSYAAHPGGGKAAYLLLEGLGYSIERSIEPMAAVRSDPASTTIVLAEPLRDPSERDVDALSAFVENGGHVIAAGASAASFLPRLWARPVATGGRGAAHSVPASYPSPLTRGAPSISVAPAAEVRATGAEWVPIYGTREDPVVLTARTGLGRMTWIAAFEPFSNGGIAAAGHAELLRNAAGDPGTRLVLWDEYYHGYGRSFWSYVAGTPLLWGVAQCGVLAIAGILTFARRRGPVRPAYHAPRTSPVEFIDTMATLYARAGAAPAAVGTALGRVRRLMIGRAGVPVTTPDGRLAATVAVRAGGRADEIVSLLGRARQAASDSELRPDTAIEIVAELMDLERRVVTTRPRPRPATRATEDPAR